MAFSSEEFWRDTARANKAILAAARRITRGAKRNIVAMGAEDTGTMRGHVGQRVRRRYGVIDRIGIRTYRYGIIREHGAGRGWKSGSSGFARKPAPWLSTAFQDNVPQLADELAAIRGDDSVREFDEMMKSSLRDRYRI